MQKCFRDVERWVAENSVGGGPRAAAGMAEKARERALEGVAEVLWAEGGLVPLAKKCVSSPAHSPLPRSSRLTHLASLLLCVTFHFQEAPDSSFPRPPRRPPRRVEPAPLAPRHRLRPHLHAPPHPPRHRAPHLPLLRGASNAELERSYVASVVAWCVELLRGVPVEPAQGLEDAAEEDEEEEEVTASVKGVVKACLLARTGPYVPSPLPRRRAHHPN